MLGKAPSPHLHCTAPYRPVLQMRETYGKLMFLLMDSCEADIQELLEFKCARFRVLSRCFACLCASFVLGWVSRGQVRFQIPFSCWQSCFCAQCAPGICTRPSLLASALPLPRCVRPLRTVYALLEERGALALLDDPLMQTATAEIVAGDRPRHEIQRSIKVRRGCSREAA